MPSDYERDVVPFVRPFTSALIASLDLGALSATPGAQVRHLDHGAGTGEVVTAVRRVDPSTTVVALDPSASMVEALRRRFPSGDVRIQATALSDAHFEEPFDLVTSQLVLMFVPDPGDEL